jgi:hypothetical protein
MSLCPLNMGGICEFHLTNRKQQWVTHVISFHVVLCGEMCCDLMWYDVIHRTREGILLLTLKKQAVILWKPVKGPYAQGTWVTCRNWEPQGKGASILQPQELNYINSHVSWKRTPNSIKECSSSRNLGCHPARLCLVFWLTGVVR